MPFQYQPKVPNVTLPYQSLWSFNCRLQSLSMAYLMRIIRLKMVWSSLHQYLLARPSNLYRTSPFTLSIPLLKLAMYGIFQLYTSFKPNATHGSATGLSIQCATQIFSFSLLVTLTFDLVLQNRYGLWWSHNPVSFNSIWLFTRKLWLSCDLKFSDSKASNSYYACPITGNQTVCPVYTCP